MEEVYGWLVVIIGICSFFSIPGLWLAYKIISHTEARQSYLNQIAAALYVIVGLLLPISMGTSIWLMVFRYDLPIDDLNFMISLLCNVRVVINVSFVGIYSQSYFFRQGMT